MALTARSQSLSGIVSLEPPRSPIAISQATPMMSLPPIDSLALRKDPFIIVKTEETDTDRRESLVFQIRPVWTFLDADEKPIDMDDRSYEKEKFLEVYMLSLEEELQSDPFYHVGRDQSVDKMMYDEQFWDALADSLRKKYRLVRIADKLARDIEHSVTLKYETTDGIMVRVKPGIERVGGSDTIILRVTLKSPSGTERIDSRIRTDGFALRLCKQIRPTPDYCALFVEYKYSQRDEVEDVVLRTQTAQAGMEIPFW